MKTEHVLIGLEPDNFLALLALVGTLRAYEAAAPEGKIRAYWGGQPLRPRLVVEPGMSQDDLAGVIAAGCDMLAKIYTSDLFGNEKDLTFLSDQARKQLDGAAKKATPANRGEADLLGALMSDAARKEDGKIKATPYCAMFGQGHQCFLDRLVSVPNGELPKNLRKLKKPPVLNSKEKIAEALFRVWERVDETESFRWDPKEDRRYALRAVNPSTDKGLTVHGANRLAAIGLPVFTAFPVAARKDVRMGAVAAGWVHGAVDVRWPVWTRPASLATIRNLLSGFRFGEEAPRGLGIPGSYRAQRISVGKYFNFTLAEFTPAGNDKSAASRSRRPD